MPNPPLKPNVLQPLLEKDLTAAQHHRQWLNEISRYAPIVGDGSPEGVVEAPQYSVYIDESAPSLPIVYRKMLASVGSDRAQGWIEESVFRDITAETILSGSITLTGNDAVQLTGDGTVWDDLRTSLIGRRLNSVAGTVTYDYAENAVVFAANGGIADTNDTAVWNFQLPHSAKLSTLAVHMHYEQEDATNRTFTLRYRIQNNGEAKTTGWTTVTADTDDSVFTYVSGTLNNILSIVDIDISGASLSSIIQCQMTRTDAESGTVKVTFVDGHFEKRGLGSGTEFSY